MLFAAVSLAILASAFAVPPNWYDGPCGQSKYSDAGDMNLPPLRAIVGGQEAREYEFPWQASMRRKSTNSHFCGGFIINDRWIMTAAHCMAGEAPAILSVVIGDHTRNANSDVRQTLDVDLIFDHEDYNSRTLENDIALVKVSQTISFNEDIQPVCGPEPTDNYEYRKSVCSGWGTLSSGGVCCPQTLQYVSLNVTTNTFCGNEYGIRYDITQDMVCASDNIGGTDRDSCQGDSGGPLVVKEADGTFTVIGIVSWGIGCASGYPGVYSRISYFNDWVLNIINNN